MSLLAAARRLARLLSSTGHKIVFAESCTAGLAAASLARVPGISAWHCGGMVTYRNETKAAYLGIDPQLLKRPGPVSDKVARLMAEGVLLKTPEATISASITGHLGPDAPPSLNGVLYLAIATRSSPAASSMTRTTRYILPANTGRDARQRLAAQTLLSLVADRLDKVSATQ
jgi:nicotinamide-nucleotide amidase